jgi:cytochrome c-type biogenesis protein CcmH
MSFAALAVSLLLSQGFAPGRAGTDPLDAQREERVMHIGKKIRCPVCQGTSIADSPASMARAQLDKVRELVAEGKTDQEIYDYFVARYGEWALLEPQKSGITAGLWIFPVLMLIGGVVFIFSTVRKRPPPAAPSAPAEDPYLKAVRADLDKP